MKNILKTFGWRELEEDQQRQYIDARAVFTEWERAVKKQAEVRGGMFWKRQGEREYLIRTSSTNAQKSLGPRSTETLAIYESFVKRKEEAEARLSNITKELTRHERMNRALYVGHAPNLLVRILDRLHATGISEYFTVVGTHALYAYEAAAGIRFTEAAMATRDIDLLWDIRKRVRFVARMDLIGSSMLGILRKVDPSFRLIETQRYTAMNDKGFEVDIIRREAIGDDPHPVQLTDEDDEFWVVQAPRAAVLQESPRFSAVVVATNGEMARMNTIAPSEFASFKRWMAARGDREPLKRQRDLLQAELVERYVSEFH